MKKSQELRKAAAESASAAAEYGQHALKEGIDLAKDGLDYAQDLLQQASEQAAPLLKEAKVRTADFASRQLDAAEPHIKHALDKVTPAVEAAREKVEEDLLPKLQDVLHSAAEHPMVVAPLEAVGLEVKPKKKSKLKTFGKVLAIGAVVAGALAAVRHFLAPKDDGWTAHEPSRAYVNNNDTFATAAKVATETKPDEEPQAEPEEPGVEAETIDEEEAEAIAEMVAEGAPTEGQHYGEGSFLGTEPPEGFTIKGNERSMKYHLPGSGGYERTNAEVWFSSEEAAEAAGFTRAQR